MPSRQAGTAGGLADDPGAGKTIIVGLLIKELPARGDLERCLIVAPGNLVEQWQDEFGEKFGLEFDIMTRDMIEASRSGNPFDDRGRLIARLDMLTRNEKLQERLIRSAKWDLIVCDEAHRMSASYFGGGIKYTKRYRIGQLIGGHCRHLPLMTATPYNGKEEDFQLFMALIDADRFEGRFREGVHHSDSKDMMRRLTKEGLLRFDARPLFPEQRARTAKYELPPGEAALYTAVTDYVRNEVDRVARFAADDGRKRINVGFALQILQRRLASSPAAIHQSLRRRRERLESELDTARHSAKFRAGLHAVADRKETLRHIDEYEQREIDDLENLIVTSATTAATVEQLGQEVGDHGTANSIVTARGISVEGVKHAGIIESAGGKVRILTREEIERNWEPESDRHLTVWECCQNLVRALEQGGQRAAALLLRKIGPYHAADANDYAYCLYDICAIRRRDAAKAAAYNDLIAVRPELTRQAAAIRNSDGDRQQVMDL
ncbi:MAG: DEAD/DEAH box helicase [Rhodobacter sp.]|nr:DEAD/DEAH box helicase [Rhodobacter sp.]